MGPGWALPGPNSGKKKIENIMCHENLGAPDGPAQNIRKSPLSFKNVPLSKLPPQEKPPDLNGPETTTPRQWCVLDSLFLKIYILS